MKRQTSDRLHFEWSREQQAKAEINEAGILSPCLFMVVMGWGAPNAFSKCGVHALLDIVIPPHFLKIVVEVKASPPPHVLKLWS